MKIKNARGAHDHLSTLHPPTRMKTPMIAGTNVYMSIVMMRNRAAKSLMAKPAASSANPSSRAEIGTGKVMGRRHQKRRAAANNGTIHPWAYWGLAQLT